MAYGNNNLYKRKRESNLIQSEKELLVNLVHINSAIIENKKTDAYSSQRKSKQWVMLAAEFNATSGYMNRSVDFLKKGWENLKKSARARTASLRQERIANGGGPLQISKDDPLMDLIMSRIKDTANHYDVDNFEIPPNNDDKELSTQLIDEVMEEESGTTQKHIDGDWADYTPAILRAPTNCALGPSQPLEVVLVVPESNETGIDRSPVTVEVPEDKNKVSPQRIADRRRPELAKPHGDMLLRTKAKHLDTVTNFVKEEHDVTMRILLLQEQQEKEKLQQEKLRTELLKAELQRSTSNNKLESFLIS